MRTGGVQADDLVGVVAEPADRLDGSGRHGHDDPAGAAPALGLDGSPRDQAGRDAVVDDDDRAPLNRQRLVGATVVPAPPPQLGLLVGHDASLPATSVATGTPPRGTPTTIGWSYVCSARL